MNTNDRKLLSSLTLGQKSLSRRVRFCVEQDAVKALQTKNLGRPTSERERIMVKQDAVKALRTKNLWYMEVERLSPSYLYKEFDRDHLEALYFQGFSPVYVVNMYEEARMLPVEMFV